MMKIYSGEDEVSIVIKKTVTFLKNMLKGDQNRSFLDIGCGNGKDIDFMTQFFRNFNIHGIDISSKSIERAIHLNEKRDNVKFECKNWKELGNQRYDIVYISGVYHFFNLIERLEFIRKIQQILKPHGYFILSTLSSNDKQYFSLGKPVPNDPNSFQRDYYLHFSSKEELMQDFSFLKISELSEFFHKNYTSDLEFHTMWFLIGKKNGNKK